MFTIGFDSEFQDHIALVDNARNHSLLQTKLAELGHPNALFKFIKSDAPVRRAVPAPAPGPAPVQPVNNPPPAAAPPTRTASAETVLRREDFKNDPLIRKALEIFKGQIVEVRS